MGVLYGNKSIVTDDLCFHVDAYNGRCWDGTSVFKDISSTRSHVNLYNTPTRVSTIPGYVSFNGSNQYASNTSFTSHQTHSGTISAWVYPTSTSGDLYAIAVGGTTTYGASRAIRIYDGQWCCVSYGSATEDWNSIAAASINTWYHIVYAWVGTTIYFYLNGTQYTDTRTGLTKPAGSTLAVGAVAWTPMYGYWPGRISSASVYNRALTQQQVLQNFNAQRSRYGI